MGRRALPPDRRRSGGGPRTRHGAPTRAGRRARRDPGSAPPPPPARPAPGAGSGGQPRTEGVLILTHRRLLVDQFRRELTEHGYGARLSDAILEGHTAPRVPNPVTIQT